MAQILGLPKWLIAEWLERYRQAMPHYKKIMTSQFYICMAAFPTQNTFPYTFWQVLHSAQPVLMNHKCARPKVHHTMSGFPAGKSTAPWSSQEI